MPFENSRTQITRADFGAAIFSLSLGMMSIVTAMLLTSSDTLSLLPILVGQQILSVASAAYVAIRFPARKTPLPTGVADR